MDTYHTQYKKAYDAYLRYGTPIELSLKQARRTAQYVWRTQLDERVRLSHRMNEGRVFSWTDTSATGHPGSAYNCRCVAIPYVPGRTEFGFFEFTTSLASIVGQRRTSCTTTTEAKVDQ